MTPAGLPRTVILGLVAFMILVGCGRGVAGAGETTLTLVAYSTSREAYDELISAYRQTAAGANVNFYTSFGSSGEQSRAVVAGLQGDVAAFALEPDITHLVREGLVDSDWNENEFNGMVTTSLVVFVVREGNPKNITTWDDLVQDGVEVINPNPFTSGGAQWNVMAAYGAQIEQGKSHDDAVDYLGALFANTPVQDKSAREALQTFAGGKGDVLIAYENEAITARDKGERVDYVIPEQTILIENPIAVVNETKNRAAAEAFIEFLLSPDGQAIFADKGYRPVLANVLDAGQYPTPPGLFTIADLGGWQEVRETFFDPTDGIIAEIERERGRNR